MPFCTACGKQNPDDARFCSQCGTRLVTPEPSPAAPAPGSDESTATISIGTGEKVETSDRQLNPVDAAAVDALPAGHALLVVQRGPGSGSRFLLDADVVTAGRHPDSEIFLDDVTVSRRHAEFHRSGDTFTVSDVGSLNGTYVNRDRIDRVQLSDGDEVQIGKYRLVFFAGHASA
jgi:pSer/pThr/pTyr-binding forkhead associated (FHA) protein